MGCSSSSLPGERLGTKARTARSLKSVLPVSQSTGVNLKDLIGAEMLKIGREWNALAKDVAKEMEGNSSGSVSAKREKELVELRAAIYDAVLDDVINNHEKINMYAIEHHDLLLIQIDNDYRKFGLDIPVMDRGGGLMTLLNKMQLKTFSRSKDNSPKSTVAKIGKSEAAEEVSEQFNEIRKINVREDMSKDEILTTCCFEIAIKNDLKSLAERICRTKPIRRNLRFDVMLAMSFALEGGKDWKFLEQDHGANFGKWRGVELGMRSRVKKISWPQCSLKARLPPLLPQMDILVFLDISQNDYYGRVDTLFRCRSLRYLDISGNNFEGELEIPPDLSKTNEMGTSESEKALFTPNIADCENLTYLDVSSNKFTGYLPEKMVKLVKMIYMDLSKNKINGVCPDITKMQYLRYCNLEETKLQLPPKYKKNHRAELKSKKEIMLFQSSFTKHFATNMDMDFPDV